MLNTHDEMNKIFLYIASSINFLRLKIKQIPGSDYNEVTTLHSAVPLNATKNSEGMHGATL